MYLLSNLVCLALFAAPPAFAPSDQSARPPEEVVEDWIAVPAPIEEVVTPRPSTETVWIPGSWERDPGKWTWVKGRWERPPDKAAHWEAGHWAWQDGKWHWRKGHWTIEKVSWIVPTPLEIPGTLYEAQPPKPSGENHWVAGHWDWDAGWEWIPGYYTTKPHPDASWVPGHWEPYGVDGYWWMGGHWRVK